jgi:hypothetical protein
MKGISIVFFLLSIVFVTACRPLRDVSAVDRITVVPLDGSGTFEIRDPALKRKVMEAFDGMKRDAVKFAIEYQLTIHYKDGGADEVTIGSSFARLENDDGYRLSCNMAELLRTIPNKGR